MKTWTPGVMLLLSCLALAPPARAQSHGRVSVQPFDGTSGPGLRQQVSRLLRGRGYRVLNSIPRVGGTGQYLSLARDHRVSAFITGDLEEGKRRHAVTFLVWNGATGAVLGRWSTAAPPSRLPREVAKGFWKHLGPMLDAAEPPFSDDLPTAPPMYIDAANY